MTDTMNDTTTATEGESFERVHVRWLEDLRPQTLETAVAFLEFLWDRKTHRSKSGDSENPPRGDGSSDDDANKA